MWTKYVLWEERLNDDGQEFNIFRIITMFGSFLPSVVCRNADVIITLFVFVCEQWCQTHILLCCFDLSSSYVLCTQCCQCFSRLSILDCAFAFIQHLSTKPSDTLLQFHFLICYARCHYIYNISVHCRKIYILFLRAVLQVEKNKHLVSFSDLFRSECKLISYLPTMYV